MTAVQSSQQHEPSHLSFEELRSNEEHVVFSSAVMRLHWPLEGVFPSTISVMKTPRHMSELDPFFRQDTNDDIGGSGTWHEISSLPLTDPKVTSVKVELRELDQWESNWVAFHSSHTLPESNPEYVTYGDLSDEDRPYATEAKEDGSWEEDSDTEFLIRCCGENRPLRKRGFKIEVTPTAGNSFVTVHDYISTVHPWLMALREDILQAKTVTLLGLSAAAVANTKWMISNPKAPQLEVLTMETWTQMHRPLRAIDATTARFLQRIGARTMLDVP